MEKKFKWSVVIALLSILICSWSQYQRINYLDKRLIEQDSIIYNEMIMTSRLIDLVTKLNHEIE